MNGYEIIFQYALKSLLLLKIRLYGIFCIPAATINIESSASPPNEGDGTGTAAVLRLTTNPTTATLAENVTVSVTVMTGGSETATGKMIVMFV